MDIIKKPRLQPAPLDRRSPAIDRTQAFSRLPRKSRVILPPLHPDGHRLQIPMAYLEVEPRPVWACGSACRRI